MGRHVGLLGGTFDPPHVGHLVVAESARVDLGLDQVRLLVAGDPWMKRTVGEAHHRVAMAQAAVVDDAHLHVDARETERDGPTYTVETLEALHHEEPDVTWHFLLGADTTARLDEWQRIEDAYRLARFVAVTRPGHEVRLDPVAAQHVDELEVPRLEISSTELRARYAEGRATRYLVPEAVDRYVRRHQLYDAVG
ncbi:nicotinate-nucleotide adenylyltransferase [Egicoccus sp. AB-alg2]|uniref:nicotinate-nucleotide adenylyltransferase n=1 Tax=Egicoccus sp. AB-alg2 TaxID=3242693 RepID=UPI00359CCA9B